MDASATLSDTAAFLGLSEDDLRLYIKQGYYTEDTSSTVKSKSMRVSLPSLDFVLDEIKARREVSSSQISTLDTKASFVLGAASLLIAGVTGFQGAITHDNVTNRLCDLSGRNCSIITSTTVVHIIAAIASLIYFGVVWSAWKAYKLQTYKFTDPIGLQRFVAHPEHESKVALLRALIKAYKEDEETIKRKIYWADRALRAFLAEAGFLTLTLLLLVVL